MSLRLRPLIACFVLLGGASPALPQQRRTTVADATVKIMTPPDHRGLRNGGSGTALKDDSGNIIILSCAHVVSTHRSVTVTFPSGRSYTGSVTVHPGGTDLASIRPAAGELKGEPWTKVAPLSPRVGDTIYQVGYPMGRGPLTRKGFLRQVNGGNFWTDCLINSGDSGGGFFNDKGQLVGVSTNKQVHPGSSPEQAGAGLGPAHQEVCSFLTRYCQPFY